MMQKTRRRFVETASGVVHIAANGSGAPVLLLHQTPRSWMEFRDVLPILGAQFHAIAMDTRGFGDSDPLPPEWTTIEGWAAAALELMDALEIPRFSVAGHHTGAIIALEIAAAAPERVENLVLSAMSFVDAERRLQHADEEIIDAVEPRDDGRHILELWERRRPHYPKGTGRDLLERFVVDALKAGPMAAEGHHVVYRYRMEDRIGRVRCPTLVLAPSEDRKALMAAPKVAAAIPGARLEAISGGTIPFPDHLPKIFAGAVATFLKANDSTARQ